MKICQTPQYREISQCKALKMKNSSILSLPRDKHLIPNTPPWVRVPRGNANAQRGWSHFKLTDPLQLIAGPFTGVKGASFSSCVHFGFQKIEDTWFFSHSWLFPFYLLVSPIQLCFRQSVLRLLSAS